MPDPVDAADFAELIERFGELLDKQDAALARIFSTTIVGAGPWPLSEAAHGGKVVRIDALANGEAPLDPEAAPGAQILVRPIGAGLPAFTVSGTSTLNNRFGHNGPAATGALVSLRCEGNVDGVSAEWWLDGDTGTVA